MSPSVVQPAPAPTHPDLILVERGDEGSFTSRAVSLKSVPAGSLFAKITGTTNTSSRTYATVQASKDHEIELNSDLVYCNHSCDPSLVFDTKKMEVRVDDKRDLEKGDALTFFYPSSEWDMAQPFDCNCGAVKCIGTIKGAKFIDSNILERYWLNQHIKELVGSEGPSA